MLCVAHSNWSPNHQFSESHFSRFGRMMEGNQSSENLESHLEKVADESAKRYPAEIIYALERDISSKYLKVLKALDYPTKVEEGWRIEAWRNLFGKPLNGISILKARDDVESMGQVSGVLDRTREMLDLGLETGSSPFERFELPRFILEVATVLEVADEKLSLNELKARFKKERRSEAGALHKNYGKGLDLLCTITNEGDVISKDPDPSTEIYWFMLAYGDYLEQMDSKKQVFEFVLDRVFEGAPNRYNFDAFKQLCKPGRLGFNVLKRRR